MLKITQSLLIWILVIISFIILFPILFVLWLITFPIDNRKRYVTHYFTSFWGSLYTWLNPLWRVIIENREKLKRGKTYILVSNHQSLVDILVFYRLKIHFKWVSKLELFKVPVLGWVMKMNKYIQLKRGTPKGVRRMMKDSENAIKEGNSLFIFPEGTRSTDGNLLPFKEGAFKLALKTQTPLLPIVIDGSGKALPKKGFILKGYHKIKIKILDEIPFSDFRNWTSDYLKKKVKDLIDDELVRLRIAAV
jgi:1-acyl-sn-glycerol-3-phosphate acyltransferase